MLDINFIRKETDRVRRALQSRRSQVNLDEILELDAEHRRQLAELESLNQQKNKANEDVARVKKEKGDASVKISEMKLVSDRIGQLNQAVEALSARLTEKLLLVPNVPADDVPVGPDAAANVQVRQWGEIKKFAFAPKPHTELIESLKLVDIPRATKISGASFLLYMGEGARLERALINFMIDTHTQEHGYLEVSPPFLVKRKSMQGTGQLPKFEDDLYRTFRGNSADEDGAPREEDLFLIPTAEVPVTNIHRDEILEAEALPIAYVAYTPCFRMEAGAAGKDTKGMVRVHQFDKVELVRFTRPEDSWKEHELLTKHAETIFQKLGIPYRVLLLSTGDMGFGAAKCYDIEVWAPGMNEGKGQWLEASSCSNFLDFQSRRAAIRYRDPETKKPRFAHTLNGSGVALARTFVALIENYQQADGAILIPEALRPYLGGKTHLGK
jgi:seryl-tRNA synthetase